MFESPGSIFLKIGPIGPFGSVGPIGPLIIRWYGVMIALGFLLATFFAMRLAKRWQVNTEKLLNCLLITFVAGVLGARLYFAALNWSYFSSHPGEILATWNGGLSIHGGIILGAIAGIGYAKWSGLPILVTTDIIAACTPLAQAIGRWGNFFNSEAFGRPISADYPLKLFIPYENRPPLFRSYEYFHPAFLYECIWDLILFGMLYFFAVERLKKYAGLTSLLYVAGYSIGRLLIEPIRVDSLPAFGLPAPLIASAAMLGLSLILVFPLVRYHKKHRDTEQQPTNPQQSPAPTSQNHQDVESRAKVEAPPSHVAQTEEIAERERMNDSKHEEKSEEQ